MLYDAQKAGSPILVTAGQHEQSFTATEPILWADLPTIARPLVKWFAGRPMPSLRSAARRRANRLAAASCRSPLALRVQTRPPGAGTPGEGKTVVTLKGSGFTGATAV